VATAAASTRRFVGLQTVARSAKRKRDSAQPQVAKRKRDSAQPQVIGRRHSLKAS
jgi:hypothetical protein